MRADGIDVVGPNAIIQTAVALRRLAGPGDVETVFARAGLERYLVDSPAEMVPEVEAARLLRAVLDHLVAGSAEAVLAEAGRLTARYVIDHRIPRSAARLLEFLPSQLSARLLLTIIARHAWTFAGSGAVSVTRGRSLSLEIVGNPLATPGCPWHVGVFETLFCTLATPRAVIEHRVCIARGGNVCRFEFRLQG